MASYPDTRTTLATRLDADEHIDLKVAAAKRDTTVSGLVTTLLRAFLADEAKAAT